MKRCFTLLLTLSQLFALTACVTAPTEDIPVPPEPSATEEQAEEQAEEITIVDDGPFPGKIAIVTGANDWNEELYYFEQQMIEKYCEDSEDEYYFVQHLVKKYGEDKIVHHPWHELLPKQLEALMMPFRFATEDPCIKALVVNQAMSGTMAALDKVLEIRDDIFIILIEPQQNPKDMSKRAELILSQDNLLIGQAMVRQAQKMGAKVFIHYSFPRHMAQPMLYTRFDIIREECKKMGLKFVDVKAVDPISADGIEGAQQFITEDVAKMVAEYGRGTAFFATDCGLQKTLVRAIVDNGAIYPQPCHAVHGLPLFLQTLDIFVGDYEEKSNKELIARIRGVLAEKDMLGRISTWPTTEHAVTTACAEYAVKWINGEVPKEGVDVAVLKQLMEDYAGVEVYLTPYTDEESGETYENFLLMRMDYITFE